MNTEDHRPRQPVIFLFAVNWRDEKKDKKLDFPY